MTCSMPVFPSRPEVGKLWPVSQTQPHQLFVERGTWSQSIIDTVPVAAFYTTMTPEVNILSILCEVISSIKF